MTKTALLCAAAMAACFSVSPAVSGEDYDGNWSVRLTTESGSCDKALSASVDVTGGRISNTGMFVSAHGSVDGQGRVALRMAGAGHTLAAAGTLAPKGGSGTWNSPSHQCSGRWVASRQG